MVDERKMIYGFVQERLRELKDNPDESIVRAQLAKMRRGVGEQPGTSPELWGILFQNFPEPLEGKGNQPGRAEVAIYMALTLYAMHQQSRSLRDENVNQPEIGFGQAVGMLVLKNPDSLEAVRRRFNATALAADIVELAWHMKGMVQLFRQKEVGLDYGQIAIDFYDYQILDQMPGVLLKWGRDFYRSCSKKNEMEEKENGTYLFLSKKDNGVVFEYKVDILDESFNLSYVHITANNDTFHIDFDN